MLKRIFQLSTKTRIAKNFTVLVAGNIIGQIFALFTTIYLARVLGVAGFGMIAFAQGIVSYFSLMINFGLRTIGTREIAKNKNELKKIVGNLLPLRIFLAIISFVFLIIFLLFIPKPTDYKILIAFFGLNMFPLVFLLDWAFQGIERMEFQGVSEAIRAFFYFVLVFLLIKDSSHLLFIPVFFIISYSVAAIFLICVFVRKFGQIRLSFQKETWKYFILSAVPIGLSGVLMQFGSNINVVLLGFLKSDAAVGGYSAANRLVTIPIGLGGFFFTAVFPVMSRYYKESREKLKNLILSLSRALIFIGIPMSVGGVILAPAIVPLIYGSEYQLSVLPFQILMGYLLFSYIAAPFHWVLPAANQQKKFFYSIAIGATVNLILNLILVPIYSLIGAAIAVAITYFIIFVMLYYYTRREIVQVPLIKNLFIAILLSSGMALVMILSNFGFIGKFLVGFFFYTFCIFILLILKKRLVKIT